MLSSHLPTLGGYILFQLLVICLSAILRAQKRCRCSFSSSLGLIQFNSIFICIALFTIQDCHKAALQRTLA